eukprot:CAMPEP_0117689630 /NCGR_PEP_ID=MMETSP0804-20121206/24617_1 /TAXON_ID=1074897 /ORGANISM="Tetraselmis astigmatica, Strain CCMP880" /LENGTH=45 /DNA_ID= /DNA_START= /DNA_END= /DNA_ORIENTATION=
MGWEQLKEQWLQGVGALRGNPQCASRVAVPPAAGQAPHDAPNGVL